jgi:NADPH:quinone reductase-like Zn-dependent oxidoreductase
MKAIVYTEYGGPDVLRLADVAVPIPNDDEVLVRVRAASANAMDWRLMRGTPLLARFAAGGLRRPKTTRMGRDMAGEVEAVGADATQFKRGDEVFGACVGAFAEYACAKASRLVPKPANVSFEQAAAVPVAGITALQALRNKRALEAGDKVLIDGASGGVGTFAIQIAKALGAEVTAVCSTANVETAKSIGADHVIDYKHEDFTQGEQRYDLIVAANAYRSIFDYRRALADDGTYVMVGGGGMQILQGLLLAPLLSLFGRRKLGLQMAKVGSADLVFLQELLASGKIDPVIDRRYVLDDAAKAIRYLEQGHAKGKVVITVE